MSEAVRATVMPTHSIETVPRAISGMVVLCGNRDVQPIVNSGSLY